MKFPNYIINSLATIGVISLIIMACSADSDNSTINNNTGSVNSIGKYQITDSGNTSFFVVDTETGVVKWYVRLSSAPSKFSLVETINTQP